MEGAPLAGALKDSELEAQTSHTVDRVTKHIEDALSSENITPLLKLIAEQLVGPLGLL